MSLQRTKIEYLTHTWNPLAMRCTPTTEGCQNCWHLRMANRLAKNPTLSKEQRQGFSGGSPSLDLRPGWDKLPKGPAVIGVQFMGDLWHGAARWAAGTVWEVMERNPRHVFICLTKRVASLADWAADRALDLTRKSHIWLGLSCELQFHLVRRLERFPVADWLSIEPMLGPIDLAEIPTVNLQFVACGPETGPGARPCDPAWIADLYRQCRARGIPFFDKRPLDTSGHCGRQLPPRMQLCLATWATARKGR